jgi:hypothetical protein
MDGSCSGGNDAYKPSSEYSGTIRAGRSMHFRVERRDAVETRCVDLPPRVRDRCGRIAGCCWRGGESGRGPGPLQRGGGRVGL